MLLYMIDRLDCFVFVHHDQTKSSVMMIDCPTVLEHVRNDLMNFDNVVYLEYDHYYRAKGNDWYDRVDCVENELYHREIRHNNIDLDYLLHIKRKEKIK